MVDPADGVEIEVDVRREVVLYVRNLGRGIELGEGGAPAGPAEAAQGGVDELVDACGDSLRCSALARTPLSLLSTMSSLAG